MTGGVLCAGRLYCDLVFTGTDRLPSLGTEVFASGLSLHPGGGAALTASYLAALGVTTRLLATLPAAPFDQQVITALGTTGVDLSFCAPAPKGTDPQLTVVMPHAADRAFLTRNDGPALPRLSPDQISSACCQHLHIGELRSLLEEPWLIAAAREAGMTISLDCGWDDGVDPAALDLIGQVDLFFPNSDEEQALKKLGMPDYPAPVTVIKRGSQGAEARAARTTRHVPAPETVVVDTTGAGDAFNGGFLSRWLVGGSLQTCLEQGVRCGSAAVSAPGGLAGVSIVSMPSDQAADPALG